MEAEWMDRATRDADECARAEAHAMVDVLEARIAELEAALRNARAQLVTLGGEALHAHGDGIQRATLAQIDAALKH